MSTARGSDQRKRAQRYKNTTAFKNDKWDKGEKLKKLNAMSVNEVCIKCRDVIQWKIKYNKYKPLGQPKSCNNCHQKTITKAYHQLCRKCALEKKQCAKCLTSSEETQIIPHEPDQHERIKMDIEMRQMIKSLSERKRRTFLRYLNGKKRKSKKNSDEEEEEAENEEEKAKRKAPKSRDDLMKKLNELTIGKEDEEFYAGVLDSEDEDFSDNDDDYEDCSFSDDSVNE